MESGNPFKRIEEEYFVLRGKLELGRITREQFEHALKDLMLEDAEGRHWILGTDSGKWNVHDGTAWTEGDPYAGSVKAVQGGPQRPLNLPEIGATPVASVTLRETAAPPKPPRGGRSCFVTGCLAVLGVLLACSVIGAVFYFRLPQQLGLFGTTPERVLSTTPDREAAARLKEELQAGGIETRGMEIYVFPIKDNPGSVAYVLLDSTKGFRFKSGARDPLIDYFKLMAQSQAAKRYAIQRFAIEFKSRKGESLLNLTAATDTINAYASRALPRAEFLKKMDGQANWLALYREMAEGLGN